MTPPKYTQAMLDEMFRVIHEKLDSIKQSQDDKLDKILVQTTKTNGRVSAVEAWKDRASGAGVLASAFIVPVMLYLLYLHIGG